MLKILPPLLIPENLQGSWYITQLYNCAICFMDMVNFGEAPCVVFLKSVLGVPH